MQLMNWIDGYHHFSQIKTSHIFRESVLKLAEQCKQVSSNIVIHNQVLWSGNGKKTEQGGEGREITIYWVNKRLNTHWCLKINSLQKKFMDIKTNPDA